MVVVDELRHRHGFFDAENTSLKLGALSKQANIDDNCINHELDRSR